ncbi:hypothetical protein ABEB22_13340 [Thioclava sp. 'Guangxiensis']|uniref:hypothetical protein n=1 Tax=Thioclava sp. 'Guangxiensis' TaxID=3149044 RepID=UPI0038782AB7
MREIGTLWIGGRLSWLEILCLKSFVDQGQNITLFSYEPIGNVPEGVIQRDGREILDPDPQEGFLKYERKDSFALFADLFRLHMLAKCPGMIWVDTDVYCHRPLDYESPYVLAYELPKSDRINNAVLGLPAQGELLQAMLEFTRDRFSVAPFLPPEMQRNYREAAEQGNPVHVSQQPWGIWGPLMVTHFTRALGLADKVQPMAAFYPVPFPQRETFLRGEGQVKAALSTLTTGLHLWASNKRKLGRLPHSAPQPGSYLDHLCRKHGVRAEFAPITSRGRTRFEETGIDPQVLAQMGVGVVRACYDLGGRAPALALAAHRRHNCDIVLVDLTEEGGARETISDWVAPYTDWLAEQGVRRDLIRYVPDPFLLEPDGLVLSLGSYGDQWPVAPLGALLPRMLRPDGRLVIDIRRGSRGFPFLRSRGTLTQIAAPFGETAPETVRVSFAPKAGGL